MSLLLRSSPTFATATLLSLAGCVLEEPVREEIIEIFEEVVQESEPPRHPLAGVELGSTVLAGPSIAIKIDTTAGDIVFEELVEGGVTRYLAVIHTAILDELGLVRSGRPQDADLVRSLSGVFVSSGVRNANLREIIRGTGPQLSEHVTSGGIRDGEFFSQSSRKPGPLKLHIAASELAGA